MRAHCRFVAAGAASLRAAASAGRGSKAEAGIDGKWTSKIAQPAWKSAAGAETCPSELLRAPPVAVAS
jgi:hypothetical protein